MTVKIMLIILTNWENKVLTPASKKLNNTTILRQLIVSLS